MELLEISKVLCILLLTLWNATFAGIFCEDIFLRQPVHLFCFKLYLFRIASEVVPHTLLECCLGHRILDPN